MIRNRKWRPPRKTKVQVLLNRSTPTPTPHEEGINGRRRKSTNNGRRHNGKYMYASMSVLSYSIHIQFFSHNQSILSLI